MNQKNQTVRRIEWICCLLSAAALIATFLDLQLTTFSLAWVSIVLCGIPFCIRSLRDMLTQKTLRSGFLVLLTIVLALLLHEIFIAGMVAFIMQVARQVEYRTEKSVHAGAERLTALTPKTAHILRNGEVFDIPVSDIKPDDLLSVRVGETVPVDGVIAEGQTTVDQSIMTGESMPVDKQPGDCVISGSINQFAVVTMRALCTEDNSSMQRMAQLADQLDAEKAPIIGQAERWATLLSVVALVIAAVVGVVTNDISRSLAILVVFCPCAFTIATSTAVLAGMANAAKYGIIIRSGDALERLSHIKKAAFDKTGTLTYGKPKLIAVRSAGVYSEEDLIAISASAEQHSEHPLGQALIQNAQEKGLTLYPCTDFQVSTGLGISASVEGHTVRLGKAELMTDTSIPSDAIAECDAFGRNEGATCIFVLIDGKYAGFLVFADTLRVYSRQMINRLHEMKIESVLLTGDHASTAQTIAQQLNISEVYADLLPEDKLNKLSELDSEKSHICMVGDGVNDSLALKSAYVSIAMGGIGSDIATNSADIVLVDDEVRKVSYLVQLSSKVMKKIRSNLFIAMSINFWFILLAALGMLSGTEAAFVNIFVAIFTAVNSAALMTVWGLDV